MSDDGLSKRERQKQRRGVKLEEQRRQEAAARRKRLALTGLVALVIVGLVGLGIANWLQKRAELAEARRVAEEQAEELGCTDDAEQPSAGAGHFENDTELRASPPETIYTDRPASSGKHHGAVVKSGFYDVKVDERLLVHNLEHGYVIVHYDEGASEGDVAAIEEAVTGHIDGDFPKMIAAPFDGEMADDKNIAFTAWTFRRTCEDFSPEILSAFTQAHHSGKGVAPEKTVPAHLAEGNGVLDPKGEDLLLPPLGTAATDDQTTDDQASEGAGATEESAEPSEGSS